VRACFALGLHHWTSLGYPGFENGYFTEISASKHTDDTSLPTHPLSLPLLRGVLGRILLYVPFRLRFQKKVYR